MEPQRWDSPVNAGRWKAANARNKERGKEKRGFFSNKIGKGEIYSVFTTRCFFALQIKALSKCFASCSQNNHDDKIYYSIAFYPIF